MKDRIDYLGQRVTVSVLTVLLVVWGGTAVVQGQFVKSDFNFNLGFPQGEFRQNVDAVGIGLSGMGEYQFAGSPVMLGLEGGFLIYGSDSRKAPFSSTVSDVTVDVKDRNWIVNGNLLLRVQPGFGKVQPYFDGIIGLSYLFTETSVFSEWNIGEPIASTTHVSDVALNYGAGAGLKLRVWERKYQSSGHKRQLEGVYIDLRFRYLFGTKAKYMKEGSITRENGTIVYDTFESRTDILMTDIGVSLRF